MYALSLEERAGPVVVNILYLTTRQFWPLDTGGKLRDFHLARELAKQARVTYVAFADAHHPEPCPENFGAPFAAIELVASGSGYTALNIARGVVGQRPLPVLKYTTHAMAERIGSLIASGRFDSVQAEGVHLVDYMAIARAASLPIVSDWHNIESELMSRYAESARGARQIYAKLTAAKLVSAEDEQLRNSDAVVVTSEREAHIVERRAPGRRVVAIENGVDTEFFRPDAPDGIDSGAEDPAGHLVFVGSMDYHANIDGILDFANGAWPAIQKRFPDLKLFVVGRNPPEAVRALAARPGIVVTGSVPDVRPYFRRALASVVPLRVGGGTRLKILESLACGTPVVSTPIGAEGIDVRDGHEMLLASTADDYIAAITRLRGSEALRLALGTAGRSFVEAKHGWASLGRRLFDVHCAIAEEKRGARQASIRSAGIR